MREWLLSQFEHFNILTVILVITITTLLGKQNTNKELKNLTDHIHDQTEELKDEIRGNARKEKD